jgi:hypothetical protein
MKKLVRVLVGLAALAVIFSGPILTAVLKGNIENTFMNVFAFIAAALLVAIIVAGLIVIMYCLVNYKNTNDKDKAGDMFMLFGLIIYLGADVNGAFSVPFIGSPYGVLVTLGLSLYLLFYGFHKHDEKTAG